MTNKEKIEKINKWQSAGFVHELTCGNNSSHKPLTPVERDNKVILVCQDCEYEQNHVPEIVLEAELKNPFENL